MSDISGLKELRERTAFGEWAGHVRADKVVAAEEAIRSLVDALIALGGSPKEADARKAAEQCVRRFNELDDGWITTIEREDIAAAICRAVELAGFECDEDWVDEREW
jgi:hypothetical protein